MKLAPTHRIALVLAAATTVASVASAQSFKISLGVRETGVVTTIGGDGTTANGIEWINKDGQTLNADGTWQKFTFNFGADPVAAFAGASANGTLASPTGDANRGTLEHIRILNDQGITNAITLLIDDVVNTVGGTDNVITGFETTDTIPAVVNTEHMFKNAFFSGSTSANIAGSATVKVIDTAGAARTGTGTLEQKFQFVDSTPTRWTRMTTFSAATQRNPSIDFTSGNKVSFWLNATLPNIVVGWNTDADGNWSDAARWAGPSAVPNTNLEIARLLPTTAPRTITVDQDFSINGININSPFAYTIAGTSTLRLTAPTTSGLDSSLVVAAGSHVITAPLKADNRVLVSVASGTSLRDNGIEAVDTLGNSLSNIIDFSSTGAGSYETAYLRYDVVTLNGDVKITAGGGDAGTSEVNTLAFAGGTTPTTKLDLTDNALIIDWDTAAAVPVPNQIFFARNRIISAYNAGAWDGKGITSSLVTAGGQFAIGYADAATLGLTAFGGRGLDSEATLITRTLVGDSDLNKNVGFSDLLALAQNYDDGYDPLGPGGPKFWTQGDFNYDGIVGFADLLGLAQTYNLNALSAGQVQQLTQLAGQGFSSDMILAFSMVPEPTSLVAVAAGSLLTLRRRRA